MQEESLRRDQKQHCLRTGLAAEINCVKLRVLLIDDELEKKTGQVTQEDLKKVQPEKLIGADIVVYFSNSRFTQFQNYCRTLEHTYANTLWGDYNEILQAFDLYLAGFRHYLVDKNYEKALEYILKAHDLFPQPYFLHKAGCIYDTMGQPLKALEVMLSALPLCPEGSPTQDVLLTNCSTIIRYPRSAKKNQEALETVRVALPTCPQGSLSQISLFTDCGMINLELNNYPEALLDFTSAIKFTPKNVVPYYGRGQCHQRLQNYEDAINDFTVVISKSEKSTDLHRFAIDQRERCIDSLKSDASKMKALEEKFSLFYERALLSQQLKDYDKAKEDCKTIMTQLKKFELSELPIYAMASKLMDACNEASKPAAKVSAGSNPYAVMPAPRTSQTPQLQTSEAQVELKT